MMNITIRLATPDDAEQCGSICYEAFKALAERHRFPPDWPSAAVAAADFERRLTRPGYYLIVAELNGLIVGSAVLDERSTIVGLGPITVNPAEQNRMIGRRLMQALLQRVSGNHCAGVRLVQNTYHNRSLCLYAKLGFEVRELLVNVQGPPLDLVLPGCSVRQANEGDLDDCNALCRRIHRHDRHGELVEAIESGSAMVVERGNRITGYATLIGFSGHAVGENNTDLQALIGAAPEFGGSGFILPARNGELFRWCLAHGLRVVQPLTLMSMGFYNEPEGSFLPSITY